MEKQPERLQKIALFLPSLNGGGAERVFVTLANSLVERGIHIDLLLPKVSGTYLSMLDERIWVVNLQARSVVFSIPALIRYLREQKPDALLSAVENANTWAILAKKLGGSSTPVIITEHNNWSQILSNQPPLKEKILFQISRNIYPLADRLVAVSNGIRADLLKTMTLDPRRVVCIYNPVVPLNVDALATAPAEHAWLSARETPVLISAGRLAKQKDFKTLLLAFQQVRKLSNCRLIILGEGPERKPLQALIQRLGLENEIAMPGFVKNPFAWFSRSDLFVMSSVYEGLPTVLIEAMACGAPVVSTDCISGPAEILDNGKYGDLVPVGDVNALAAAIVENLKHPRPTSQVKDRANLFSIKNAADAYLELIEKVVAHE